MTFFLAFCIILPAWCNFPAKRYENMPDGKFKKTITGKIIQYDSNGKKVAKYKKQNGKFVKIK